MADTQSTSTNDRIRSEDQGSGSSKSFSAADASKIQEHMDVVASDGQSIGKVDHLDGERIKLTKNDSPDHQHHYVPFSWIDHIDRHVHLNKSLADIKSAN